MKVKANHEFYYLFGYISISFDCTVQLMVINLIYHTPRELTN